MAASTTLPVSMLKRCLRLASCSGGAALALGLVLWLVDPPDSPLLVASFGGTAVFLFGLTGSPAAQPRSLFGGHLGGALVGIACYQALGDAPWVYALALALTLVLMLVTRTVHPPAGANPLIMVHAHAGFAALLQPVGVGVMLLALTAMVWTRLMPGAVRYPCELAAKSPSAPWWGAWNE